MISVYKALTRPTKALFPTCTLFGLSIPPELSDVRCPVITVSSKA